MISTHDFITDVQYSMVESNRFVAVLQNRFTEFYDISKPANVAVFILVPFVETEPAVNITFALELLDKKIESHYCQYSMRRT